MIEIIPAIDIIGGKCVRLFQGDYNQKKEYDRDPLEIAKEYESHGIKRLHIVDLDGAKSKHVVNHKILERIAFGTHLEIDFGGGIKTDVDIRKVFDHGADLVTIGSVAVTDKRLFKEWLKRYGSDSIILGADVKDEKIAISGWEKETEITLFNFLEEYASLGVQYVLCSDISKDGTFMGTSVDLYKKVMAKFPDINLIASGGFADISEIDVLSDIGTYGVIIGKALLDGKITLKQIRQFIKL
jgi:phosphoribosylformimino-5-aminoimidazole carboxamide ribotide isomerase